MNQQTLEALQGSIAAWDRRAKGEFSAASVASCPLCKLFYSSRGWSSSEDCSGCPIERVKGKYCIGTPYEYYSAVWNANYNYDVGFFEKIHPTVRSQLMVAAQQERDFLISLLPAGETYTPKPIEIRRSDYEV